ncbi:bifunctional 2-C-methyl-D-erythritol 4-phosphate cytidylyltransferase/2-C-methyl-D-erythritol 2,4-cyclodiphosphate synthase [Jannaschia seohaensis]|uniref:Bifunctional enzyme IspD/IspF n=1 Tax=Jannaschia seohaensis TaxID=475081 RepID=A0A2Y9B3P9_9RHOB|nr:bifunctional 2-C-methyl-D-erythritol 4-phosphate cytidylyltransferase/2-C-methyl-D-erythritol 2,4-cyclodiphosphate synthase [Jannaschia seohaensis]PWJ15872.1 2-C-methyl-D-erythritol 4-phosphate cytidylyltransferase/2-C-methyl-D-erythritol 2,4-cyclodiphosphate synthase [Jannaschia seohaensis]SSA49577.1 2-C-methyl-D-erythritol 4-phosphate cytidylyltransferase / 2-C-methyl-D-erythritol 2,4-cyclodiphosphate synthase [Jannaschia seohaensis]
MADTETTVMIVAAGRGTRAGGGIPKQFRALRGKAIVAHSLAAFEGHVADAVLVIHPDDVELAARACPGVRLIPGGATRAASVAAGLAAVETDRVLVHDAARPLVPAAVIARVMAALDDFDAAAPALAVTDALWRGDTRVTGLQDRRGLLRAQTPQGFRTAALRAAHAAYAGEAADDVEVARAAGIEVAVVQGDEINLKITRPEDFARAERLMGAQMDIRVGNGFDVHRFGPGDHVMLCGVAVPHDRGLQGHSDADVGLHTLADAIYGALAEGDIGRHFPPSDPQWKGAESGQFLRHAADLARARGFSIANLDCTLICERPKIGPHADAMRARVAELAGVEIGRVSVKATTTERLGFAGRGEGIACQATVALVTL